MQEAARNPSLESANRLERMAAARNIRELMAEFWQVRLMLAATFVVLLVAALGLTPGVERMTTGYRLLAALIALAAGAAWHLVRVYLFRGTLVLAVLSTIGVAAYSLPGQLEGFAWVDLLIDVSMMALLWSIVARARAIEQALSQHPDLAVVREWYGVGLDGQCTTAEARARVVRSVLKRAAWTSLAVVLIVFMGFALES